MELYSQNAYAAAAAAKSPQSCPILCDPIDGSPPGSAVPGILQARTLEWVAISQIHFRTYFMGKDMSQIHMYIAKAKKFALSELGQRIH